MSLISLVSGYFGYITKVSAETKTVSTSSSPPNIDVGEVRNELETMNSLPSDLIRRPYDASKYSLLVQECIRRLEEYQGKGGLVFGSQPLLELRDAWLQSTEKDYKDLCDVIKLFNWCSKGMMVLNGGKGWERRFDCSYKGNAKATKNERQLVINNRTAVAGSGYSDFL